MFLSRDQLRQALSALDVARTQSENWCKKQLVDNTGKATHAVAVKRNDVQQVPYGEHGHTYLTIDPETLEIHCGACKGDVDATLQARG